MAFWFLVLDQYRLVATLFNQDNSGRLSVMNAVSKMYGMRDIDPLMAWHLHLQASRYNHDFHFTGNLHLPARRLTVLAHRFRKNHRLKMNTNKPKWK